MDVHETRGLEVLVFTSAAFTISAITILKYFLVVDSGLTGIRNRNISCESSDPWPTHD